MPQADAHRLLEERLTLGRELLLRPVNSPEKLRDAQSDYSTWDDYNETLLATMLDAPSMTEEYGRSTMMAFVFGQSFDRDVRDFQNSLRTKLRRLESIKVRLELLPGPTAEPGPSPSVPTRERSSTVHPDSSNNFVFVVHGREPGPKESVARLLSTLGLTPIILHEQAGRSRTIIEKFEDHSDVGFAVVLMTPDDLGQLAADPGPPTPRVRENVVFELGFFMGKLGRHRVCALLAPSVDKPSDIDGVNYVPLDSAGGWRFLLAKELRAAGYDIDTNAIA